MSRRNKHRDYDLDDDDEEGGEENYDEYDEDDGFIVHSDFEEDEDEDEDEEYTSKKSKKKKTARNIFIDDTAIDSEGDEDFEEEEEEGEEGFIDHNEELVTSSRPSQYNRRPVLEEEESAEDIAKRMNEKYAHINEDYMADTSASQRGIIPTLSDPSLWMLKCKPGKEKTILRTILERVIRSQKTRTPIDVVSAFYRENLKGFLYIEAFKLVHVKKAIDKIQFLYGSNCTLVPRKEQIDVLEHKNKGLTLKEKDWARIKRGKYTGDLCQILRISDDQDMARVRLIPRIDMSPNTQLTGKRRPAETSKSRPPQRFFNRKEIDASPGLRGTIIRSRGYFVFNGENYKDGFLEKDVKISALQTENVNPSLDEVTFFSSGLDNEEDKAKLLASLTSSLSVAHTTAASLKVGDRVEILEGNMSTLVGILIKIDGDVGTVQPQILGLENLSVPLAKLRKHYKIGDHVQVTSGKYQGDSGFIVKINDKIINLISDATSSEIQVFIKDLAETDGPKIVAQKETKYAVLDSLQIDNNNNGIIVKIGQNDYKVLDQNNVIKSIPFNLARPVQNRRAIAMDSRNNPLKVGDQVKSIRGDSRQGTILLISKDTAFIQGRESFHNAGVVTEKVHFLVSQVSNQRQNTGSGVVKDADGFVVPPNPSQLQSGSFRGGRGGGIGLFGGRGRGKKRDPLLDKTVNIKSGPYKGYIGVVKDIVNDIARVELHTNSKVITVNKSIIDIPGDPNARTDSSYAGSSLGTSWNARNASSGSIKSQSKESSWTRSTYSGSNQNYNNSANQYGSNDSGWNNKSNQNTSSSWRKDPGTPLSISSFSDKPRESFSREGWASTTQTPMRNPPRHTSANRERDSRDYNSGYSRDRYESKNGEFRDKLRDGKQTWETKDTYSVSSSGWGSSNSTPHTSNKEISRDESKGWDEPKEGRSESNKGWGESEIEQKSNNWATKRDNESYSMEDSWRNKSEIKTESSWNTRQLDDSWSRDESSKSRLDTNYSERGTTSSYTDETRKSATSSQRYREKVDSPNNNSKSNYSSGHGDKNRKFDDYNENDGFKAPSAQFTASIQSNTNKWANSTPLGNSYSNDNMTPLVNDGWANTADIDINFPTQSSLPTPSVSQAKPLSDSEWKEPIFDTPVRATPLNPVDSDLAPLHPRDDGWDVPQTPSGFNGPRVPITPGFDLLTPAQVDTGLAPLRRVEHTPSFSSNLAPLKREDEKEDEN